MLTAATLLPFLGILYPQLTPPSQEPTTPEPATIFVIDNAIALNQSQSDLVVSLAALYGLQDDVSSKAVLFYGQSAGDVMVLPDFRISSEVSSELALQRLRMTDAKPTDIAEAIFVTGEYFDDIDAPAGSRVLLLTQGSAEEDAAADISEFTARFVANEWILDIGVTGQLASDSSFSVVEDTGGEVLSLISPLYISELIKNLIIPGEVMDGVAQQSFGIYNQFDSDVGDDLTFNFSVPPQSDSIQLVLYLQHGNDDANVRIFRPNGTVLEQNSIAKTENVIIYRSPAGIEPESGRWEIQVNNNNTGFASLALEIDNPLRLNLLNQSLAFGSEGILQVQTTINDTPGHFADIELSASVAQADEANLIYELKDDGINGDAVAFDGTYSANLPAFSNDLTSTDVALNLRWPDYGIEFQQFLSDIPVIQIPTVVIENYNSVRILPTSEWRLAEARVLLDGEPYYVAADDLSVVFHGDDTTFTSRLEPLDDENGLHSRFAVWGAPTASDTYAAKSVLSTDFTEADISQFQFSSAPKEITVSNLPPSFSARPIWFGGLPVWLPILLPFTLLVLVVVAIKLWRRPRPFGYLYDEDGNMLENFSDVKRSLWRRLLMPSTMNARELNSRFSSSLRFKFKRSEIKLIYKPKKVDIGLRLDGKPCSTNTSVRITKDIWIGYGGRLMRISHDKAPAFKGIGYDLNVPELN